jgi:hypothetical protein
LNTVSNSLYQLHTTRKPTASGNRAAGVTLYCYYDLSSDKVSRQEFLKALTQPSRFDPSPEPIFAKPVPTPAMPWKTNPTQGHLKGFIDGGDKERLDGAKIVLTGPKNQTVITDATGFYGAVDLPPGNYKIEASFAGHQDAVAKVTIKAGAVADKDLHLKKPKG